VTLRRYQGLHPSKGTQWPRDVRAAIHERDDNRCVCARADFPLEVIARCGGSTELDHVRASGAIGMKSRSTVDNGVTLSAVLPPLEDGARQGSAAAPPGLDRPS
jgi:hypothetical protein